MTRIWNPYTFTPLGNPIVGEAPPVLRVMGGMQATAQQLAYAQQRFTQFVMQARLSVVPNPTEAGRLQDGTQYRIVVVGPQTVMEIWPGGAVEPIDSKSAIYVEFMPPGGSAVRYLLRPKGGIADPGRPWRVEVIPEDGSSYLFAQNDAPWANSLRTYGQGTDVTWHGTQGKSKKNYLVAPALRYGATVATLSVAGSRNNVPKEFNNGGVTYFGNLIINPTEVRSVIYESGPFAYRENRPPEVPYLIPVQNTVVFSRTNNSTLAERIIGVSESAGGSRFLMLVERVINPQPDPPVWPSPLIDQWGRHEHYGCVSLEVLFHTPSYRMVIDARSRPIADPDVKLEVDEYSRQGLNWSRTNTTNAKLAGSCSPPKFRISHPTWGPPTFTDVLDVHQNIGMPPQVFVSTSGDRWSRQSVNFSGTARFQASSRSTYDELVSVQRYTRSGGVSTVKEWGNEDYSVDVTVSRQKDALRYEVLNEGGQSSVTEYTNQDESVEYSEHRRVERGLMLGNRRLTTFKTDVSMSGDATREYRSDYYLFVYWSSENYVGATDISVRFEGRSLIAYDPFLDLLCYSECKYDYSARFAAGRQIDRPIGGPDTDVTTGSDCFLPITQPPAVDLVIECRGQTIRVPIPALTEDDGSSPDTLYREKAQKVPWLSSFALFNIPGYRPAAQETDAQYIEAMRGFVAGGLADAQTGNWEVYGIPSGSIASFNRNRLFFGAMHDASDFVSAEYATDPRTGGAVLAIRWRGKIHLAYAVDLNGIRPLTDVLPDMDPAHITTIGSA